LRKDARICGYFYARGFFKIAQINGTERDPSQKYAGTRCGTPVFGLKLGLIGFVLAEAEGAVHIHNPLSKLSLCSFWLFGNWVCFA